jgi:hypothetical protein
MVCVLDIYTTLHLPHTYISSIYLHKYRHTYICICIYQPLVTTILLSFWDMYTYSGRLVVPEISGIHWEILERSSVGQEETDIYLRERGMNLLLASCYLEIKGRTTSIVLQGPWNLWSPGPPPVWGSSSLTPLMFSAMIILTDLSPLQSAACCSLCLEQTFPIPSSV